jgi:hypothetical protein
VATATTLAQAAGQAYDNLHIRWLANQLGGPSGVIALFCKNALPVFPNSLPGGIPVANWLTIFYATGVEIPATNVPINQLTDAAEILYRLCWMASVLTNNGITTTQAAQLLAQYNTIIGFP